MKCNNTHCLWNAFDTCCHESEEAYDKATPNQLDCPVSLRKDHQQSMFMIIEEVNEMMMKRNFRELAAIHSFVAGQRPDTSKDGQK